MKKTIAVMVISGILSLSSLAQAGGASERAGAYGNLGATWVSADVDLADLADLSDTSDLGDTTRDINIFMATGRLGYRINDYFGVEGEASFGFGDDSIDETIAVDIGAAIVQVDAKAKAKITSAFGGFIVGYIPITDRADLFGRAGYGYAKGKVKASAEVLGTTISDSVSDSVDDFAYGVGGQYLFDEKNGVRLEYSGLGSDLNTVSLSYVRRF